MIGRTAGGHATGGGKDHTGAGRGGCRGKVNDLQRCATTTGDVALGSLVTVPGIKSLVLRRGPLSISCLPVGSQQRHGDTDEDRLPASFKQPRLTLVPPCHHACMHACIMSCVLPETATVGVVAKHEPRRYRMACPTAPFPTGQGTVGEYGDSDTVRMAVARVRGGGCRGRASSHPEHMEVAPIIRQCVRVRVCLSYGLTSNLQLPLARLS